MLIKTAWWLYSVNSTTRQAGGTDPVRGHIGEIGRRFSATGHPYEPTHAGVRYFADRALFAIIGKLNNNFNLGRDTYEGSRVPRRWHRRA
jgi:hypothetical protein